MSDVQVAPSTQPAQPAGPAPGTPEYDAAMVAKFDGANGQPATPPQPDTPARPEWLPEKYATAEDFAKAHKALEAEYTRLRQATAKPAATPASTPDASQPVTEQTAAQAVQSAGLNMDALSQEFAEHGTLTDESYAALEKAGIPKAMVDEYIDGQIAKVQLRQEKAFSVVGNEQNYRALTDWAKANLSAFEVDAYNRAVSQGTPDEVVNAVRTLAQRMQFQRGNPPALVHGQQSGAILGYRSTAEMIAAMSDPKYQSDSAYRTDVERRVAVSTFRA